MFVVIGCMLATPGRIHSDEPGADYNIYLVDNDGIQLTDDGGNYLTCGKENA